jgi:hypothetical protein
MSYFEQCKKDLDYILENIQYSFSSLCKNVEIFFSYIGLVNLSPPDIEMSKIISDECMSDTSPDTSCMSDSTESEGYINTISQRSSKDNSFENISDEPFEII